METHEIISVKIVTGASLNPKWRNNMQVIETNKGTYIDNLEGAQFGFYNDANPGYNWSGMVGKTVSNVKIYQHSGFQWLNKR